MYKYSIILLTLFSWSVSQAQRASKVTLAIGQKIVMKSTDSTNNTQKRGEEKMDMKTYSSTVSEYEVIGKSATGYTLKTTLQKIYVNFDGFGQKMEFDSEDPKKQEGMMADQIKDKVGKADTIEITLDGKKVDEEGDDKGKGKGKGQGRRMMRMMDQQSGNIENAFLFVPAEAKEGNGWKKDDSKETLKSQTIYFVEKINGQIAEISFKKKTKGTRTLKREQGEMVMEIDNLSSGTLLVDMTTGLVKSFQEEENTNTKMNMMGQDMPSTGRTVSKVVFE